MGLSTEVKALYKAIFADEALEQLDNLDKVSRNKIYRGIRIFEAEGKNAQNSRDLGDIWEIKADNVRAYFDYEGNKIIIIGLIVLKKSQKAPIRFINQAKRNIEKVKQMIKKGEI